jgi:cold shock CspA family protein
MINNMRGTIKWYHPAKHIGFLVTNDDNREMFMHINDCLGFVPEAGMAVEFETGIDGRGRVKAIRIERIDGGGAVGRDK